MSDATVPENDAQDDAQDGGSGDTTNTLRREDIPDDAHITACGEVFRDGERLGEIDRGGASSADNPQPSDGDKSVLTTLHENTRGYVSAEVVEDLRGDGTEGVDE
ncbi:hypothetical protein DJ68_18230 [Halorubrum sp. C3]|nr:hypothetical protein DJ68_18230 [Halorubrum sp. C3]